MTELLPDAPGSIFLIRRAALQTSQSTPSLAAKHTYNPAAIGISLTSFVLVEKPPPPFLPRPAVEHQSRLSSGESSKHSQDPPSKQPQSAGELFYANFSPTWGCTCVLVVIDLFFCPILAFIGCMFEFVAKERG